MRTVPEWIGETPETAVPLRVKIRVFDAHGGRCHWSGKKIAAGDRWDVDHIRALINGGENRESNLAPILREKHKEKTARDIDEKAKVARLRAKHLGLWPKSHFQIPRRTRPHWARMTAEGSAANWEMAARLNKDKYRRPVVTRSAHSIGIPKGSNRKRSVSHGRARSFGTNSLFCAIANSKPVSTFPGIAPGQNSQGDTRSRPAVAKSLRFRVARRPPLTSAIAAIMPSGADIARP